jgi:alpha-2-macroglobulin
MRTLTTFRPAVAVAMAFLLVPLLFACKKRRKEPINPAFAEYIAAFTSGSISAATTVRIRFTRPLLDSIDYSQPVNEDLIDFSPSIDGKLFWVDAQTLEFRPSQWMERGKTYDAVLALYKLTQVPQPLREFSFSFQVIEQHVQVSLSSVRPYRADDLRWMYITGALHTTDVCDVNALKDAVYASQEGRDLKMTWSHDPNGRIHTFTADSIERKTSAGTVSIRWDGAAIEAGEEGDINQEIPAIGDFKVFFHQVIQQPEQYVLLQFSDPIQNSQDLNGLIEILGQQQVNITQDLNEVRVYPTYRLTGDHTLVVHQGVKNVMGYALQQEQQFPITFEDLKPAVEIPDQSRIILPSTDGLVFPFRAVNLSAVDVKVIQIYESNVAQFLQVNDLNGTYEMRRVGRPVATTKVLLNEQQGKNLAQWNTFYLDLKKITQTEPGAIYRVEIGFKKAYSLYLCAGTQVDEMQDAGFAEAESWDESAAETSAWDGFEGYYYDDYSDEYYGWDYEYDEKDNPCNEAYFKHRKPVGKNILASDIGLLAKQGADGSILVAASNIVSAAPLEGVNLEVLNYQQQVIAKSFTNVDGMATIEKTSGTPHLLVATKGRQKGYLKLESGEALSVSSFDVQGEQGQKGLKGFIYGERGVWRPGDTLHLSFILEDERHSLPEVHPVHFELVSPRGQTVQKLVKSSAENGFYTFKAVTEPGAETGGYTANVRVGSAVFSKTVKVETIKPNRLKVEMDFGTQLLTGNTTAELKSRWLHGASARNLKTVVSATYSAAQTSFGRYTDFTFDDPVRTFNAEERTVYEGFTDANGNAKVPVSVELSDKAPGMLMANYSIRVFEQGGDFSSDRASVLYSPYQRYVGVKLPKGDKARGMLLTDTDHKVEVATVDANGKPTSAQDLKWRVYKVNWRWWWETASDDLASYVGSESTVPIANGSLSTSSDGKGMFTFRIDYPEWGRYLVRIEDEQGGHATGKAVYVDWPGWAGRAQKDNPGGASHLMIALDKDKYQAGEDASFSFSSNENGRALITIENGGRVLLSEWVNTGKERTAYSFKTTAEMSPNAYISVSAIQPHQATAGNLPIRTYGIVPVFVENPDSHIEPVIAMSDELAPEKDFEIRVNEKSGKAMTYTLAIVDEGLLDLTRFKTPDPWNHFYAREALGVKTFDVYDHVMGAFGTKVEQLLSIGGDGEAGEKGKAKANRFKPVVIYAGPFTLDKGGAKSHRFTMPNYVGSVRVMVVAGKDMAYGKAEKAVPVKKPVMVLATMPRVIGPGEEITLPVNVFVMDKNVKKVDVKVECNDLLIVNTNRQTMSFSEPGDDIISFNVKAGEKMGVARLKVIAEGGGHTSMYSVELDVRNPNPTATQVVDGIVMSGQTWNGTFDEIGIEGTSEVVMEVSAFPGMNLQQHLKYLLQYPHGCAEQTTSAAFPQLYAADLMKLNKNEADAFAANVKRAIARLQSFQNASGGFAYWPGEAESNDWISSYVGHFLLEAKAKGFVVPDYTLNQWSKYQTNLAVNWRFPQHNAQLYHSEQDLMQAYRLYTLSLAGKADLGAMNRLREYNQLTTAAKWRLAATYALAGQVETAKQLAYSAPREVNAYTVSYGTYGSDLRDDAMMAETLVLLNDRSGAVDKLRKLATKIGSGKWFGTHSLAYAFISVSRVLSGEAGNALTFTYTLNGMPSGEKRSQNGFYSERITTRAKGNTIGVSNKTGNALFVRLIVQGQPASGAEMEYQEGVNMTVMYKDMRGATLDVARLEQGTDFIAEVSLQHKGGAPWKDVALSQVFPGGWEIIPSRLDVTGASLTSSPFRYQDIRDDRVYTYFDLYEQTPLVYKVKLTAAYLGRYYLPGVQCEAMYDRAARASTKGKWVQVVPSGGALAQVKKP